MKRLFAIAAPGLEGVVRDEVCALPGAGAVSVLPGGVEFSGDDALLYRANLMLRCASRVLLRLGQFTARDFSALRRGVAALPWRDYAGGKARARIVIRAAAHRSRLYHTGAIAERVLKELAERGIESAEDAPSSLEIFLRAEDDVFTVSIDTSGELLHRRGFRSEAGEAPLRETLAAAMCRLCAWSGEEQGPLRDPTCGSGTLLIEAALLACRRAPGLQRAFAFQRFAGYRPERFLAVCREVAAGERRCPAGLIAGSDLSAEVLKLAQRNAERAGVAELISFDCADVAKARLPTGTPGLVLCNPPYGRRLDAPNLRRLYRAIGQYARSAPGWRLGFLCPHPALAQAADRQAVAYPLSNSGLRIGFYVSAGLPEGARGYYAGGKIMENGHEYFRR